MARIYILVSNCIKIRPEESKFLPDNVMQKKM